VYPTLEDIKISLFINKTLEHRYFPGKYINIKNKIKIKTSK
jgi:hypothetical protein